MNKLNKSYSDMKSQVNAAHDATSTVLGEANSLIEQRQQLETKQHLLKAFKDQFVLSDDEISTLTMLSEPVDDRFFAALGKAKRIRNDCQILLGFENQTLGSEIMEQTSKHINQAFQKLYKWIQREFKTLNLENPQIGSAIRRSLRVLAERPTLFQSCLDFFAEAREQILSDAFFTALTGNSTTGNHNSSVKPIELVAHDTLRYVGDMLAWTHSAAVGEKEALEVLFVAEGEELTRDIQAGRQKEVWRLADEDGETAPEFDPLKALNDLVDSDVSGAARILRQRVEQVIRANEEIILAYKLANLLNFYRVTFTKLLGEKSALVESLSGLESEALRQFRFLVRDQIATLQADFQHTPEDLSPPEFLLDALKQLAAIMKTYDTSLTASDSREEDFQPILVEALDPFVKGCENIGENIDRPDKWMFAINCLESVKAALAIFDFTQGRVDQLGTRVEESSRKLADSQYAFLCRESGLEAIFGALSPLEATPEDAKKIRSLNCLQPQALSQASQDLDGFLPSALMDAVENLKQLQNSKLAREITEDAAERFCVEFEHVSSLLDLSDEVEVNGKEQEAQSLRELFPRTIGEIRVLLS